MENPISICQECSAPTENKYSVICEEHGRICFECCGTFDKKIVDEFDEIDLFLRYKDKALYVQNLTGSLMYKIIRTKVGKRNKSCIDVWFIDHNGIEWTGVNYGIRSIVHCRKLKERLN